MSLFESHAKKPPATPPPLPAGHDGRRLRVIGVPPGQSAANAVSDVEGVSVRTSPPNPAPVAIAAESRNEGLETVDESPFLEPLQDVATEDPLQRALQAVRDGAPSVVAVTFLDGDRWRHVVSTNDFPHREHRDALGEWSDQLRKQREADGAR